MKKKVIMMIFCLMAITIFTSTAVMAAGKPKLLVNGKVAGDALATSVRKGIAYVSIRAVADAEGCEINYDVASKTAIMIKGDREIVLTIDQEDYYVDGVIHTTTLPPYLENNKTYIHLSVIKNLFGLNTYFNEPKNTITLDTPKEVPGEKPIETPIAETAHLLNVVYSEIETYHNVDITLDNPANYEILILEEPNRFIVDLKNTIVRDDFPEKAIGKSGISKIRTSQFDGEKKITRIVLDLDNLIEYRVVQSADKKNITLTTAPASTLNPPDMVISGTNKVSPMEYLPRAISDQFTMKTNQKPEYSIEELANPRRLVVNIKNAFLENANQEILAIKGFRYLTVARAGQFETDTARLVFEINEGSYYKVEAEGNQIVVNVSKLPYTMVNYKKGYDNAVININPENTIEGHIIYDEVAHTVRVVYAGDLALDVKKYEVNDNLVKFYSVEKVEGQTIVLFQLMENVAYEAKKTASANIVEFTLKKIIRSISDITIYIDPGHGGTDPGAIGPDKTQEKNLNLDVATRLNAKLKALGFNTIMSRSTDVYVTLHDRVKEANGAFADFYISTHFNSLNSKTEGLMMLYYPNTTSDIYKENNKNIARIFQNEAVKALGLKDKGEIERPGLYVLNKTQMPAILAELGFISNPTELKKIKKAGYTENAAIALTNSIVRYFEEIKGVKIK